MESTMDSTNGEQVTEVIVPEGAELIDECFYVWETRYGLYSTMTKEGRNMKCEQEGTLHLYTRVVNSTQGVKL